MLDIPKFKAHVAALHITMWKIYRGSEVWEIPERLVLHTALAATSKAYFQTIPLQFPQGKEIFRGPTDGQNAYSV